MATYKIQIPMTGWAIVKAVGKKNGKIVCEIIEAKNTETVGLQVRFEQEWLNTSPSVTKLD